MVSCERGDDEAIIVMKRRGEEINLSYPLEVDGLSLHVFMCCVTPPLRLDL